MRFTMTNVLIAVSGSTPSIITETLYHYLVNDKITINEIHVITTAIGQRILHEKLTQNGVIYNLYKDHQLDLSLMPNLQLHVIQNRENKPLEDVRTREDNEDAARTIINFIRGKASVKNNRLFCTLSGGRKTMSSHMGLAMNIFGRVQDELSHVLVSPEDVERDHNFYYPRPGDTTARVELAKIPFFRLREKLENTVGNLNTMDYDDLITIINGDLQELEQSISVTLNTETRYLGIRLNKQETKVRIPPKLIAIYHLLFEEAGPVDLFSHPKYGHLKLKDLYEEHGHGKSGKFDKDNIGKAISEFNTKFLLKLKVSETIKTLLAISKTGDNPPRYQIQLPYSKRMIVSI